MSTLILTSAELGSLSDLHMGVTLYQNLHWSVSESALQDLTSPSASPFSWEDNSLAVIRQKLCVSINHIYSSSMNRMLWTVIISSVFLCSDNIFFSWFTALALIVWSPNIWKISRVLSSLTHKCQCLCFWGCEWLLMFPCAGFLNKTHTG